jgi:hypothetical protein
MSPMSAEATVVRNYLDWLLSLPWNKKKPVKKDLKKAEEILDADHYGLEKVKERILEYLAVQAAHDKGEGADPVPRRSARRRQDVARQIDRRGDGASTSYACRSAACAMKRKSAVTAAPISARCRAASSSP